MSDILDGLFMKRRKLRIPQYQLAKHLNITQGALSHYERGRRKPSIKILKKWAKYLKYNLTLEGKE